MTRVVITSKHHTPGVVTIQTISLYIYIYVHSNSVVYMYTYIYILHNVIDCVYTHMSLPHIQCKKNVYMYLYIYIYTHYYDHKMCAGYLKPPKPATSERSTQGVDRLASFNGRAQDALETPRTEKKGRAGISK